MTNQQVLLRELTRIVEVARDQNYSNEFIGKLVRSLPEFSVQDIYDLRKANGLNPYDGTAVEPREEYGECPTCRAGTVDHGKRVHAEGCPQLNRGAGQS